MVYHYIYYILKLDEHKYILYYNLLPYIYIIIYEYSITKRQSLQYYYNTSIVSLDTFLLEFFFTQQWKHCVIRYTKF